MNPLSVTALIQKCTTITSLKKAYQLHALILTTTISTSYAQCPYLNNNILSMYARCGSLFNAKKLFDKMPQRNIISYNALISAFSRDFNHGFLSLKLFALCGHQDLRPNGSTFSSSLQACCFLEDWFMGSVIHGQAVKHGVTSLLGMYSNCGDLESANKVFGCVVEKDVVLWNSMIFGNLKNEGVRGRPICLLQNALLDMYCSCGDTKTGFNVFNKIENPDLVSWNSMISGYAENGEGVDAMNLFLQLVGVFRPKPDEYTFAAVISATGAFSATCYGKPLHAQVMKVGSERSVFIGTTLLSMYLKNGDTESAEEVFNMIEEKDAVLWTEMIVGHTRLGGGEIAIKLFCMMCHEGHNTDSFALSGALSACADLATLKQGEMIHTQAVKRGCDAEISVCGSLVHMYAKNGDLHAARSIFCQFSNPDLKCWNSMLGGYSQHGMAEEAMILFAKILVMWQKPDQVTFLSLLSACSHSGLVEEGKLLWSHIMKNGVIPGPKHYSCMVSLLSRAGLLDEAEELIIKSTYSKDHLELWRTLLSSCVNKRNFKIGVRAAEEILKLEPEDSATHILLSNLYAAAGRWDGVAEMRRKMRGLMLEKDPGLSWIEEKQ
uniref:Pentacotripeptide-repeat region of PRORP domain-containing protein n=1 Tax=Salix viminalis TaxID=40686 RepID=A0A6N2N7Z6_SALVM